MMDARLPQLADQLLLIERELRLLGWWEELPPAPEQLASQEPFCVDTLDFHQWLQWIFLVRMKGILEQGLPLPSASGILAMAEMAWQARPETAALRQQLEAFDALITQG